MIYLDNSATTKIDKRVIEKMTPYLSKYYGNPSSVYKFGQISRRAIDRSREIIANYLNSDLQEIIFTSGGTESNNLALKGIVNGNNKNKISHIITSEIEHDSILNTLKEIKNIEVTYIKPDQTGKIKVEDVDNAIKENTILISIIHANSEIGVIQDIENIGKIAKKNNVLFHVDAMQSLKYLDIDVNKFNIDLLTFGAHKINGPKGIGALYIKRGTPIQALIKGGSQEYRIRGGTENLSAIVGFGEAVELLKSEKYKRQEYVKTLRDNFERDILKINGTKLNSNASNRMPHLSNILFDKINSESMLIQLDLYNISASAGSACSSLSIEPSHVLTSIGLTEKEAKHSIRFSLGHENTQIEIEKTIQVIKEILNKYE